ncbi:bifunctional serine/threonine-protein kinase/ABC transporter substrate-binding protein [Frankia sp. Cas3]|uniref:bifunctional serine/threonine-protein kinase/ABC transporter substrate-binding protein n=1 Tax=Frankia sp. Cas3 TaxID=3073926 RepID=UPI002AD598BE|nr:bifunctional serine/threonine-protein kinase/ABC transporter substrate-binding protein [Frankia sp. Cas3]
MTIPAGCAPGDPERIGPYIVRGRLGAGGMGIVYRAEDPQGRVVALKAIRPEIAGDPTFRTLFRREARNARQVMPFCTAPVLDVDADAEQPYIVTEFVDGPTLSAAVERRGPLAGAELHQLAVAVVVAMIAIHDAGIVHCDLKPSNVLLSPFGPRIIDFGVSRAVDATTAATQQTGLFGTPAFMAPEQIKNYNSVTPAADVFAWGGLIAYAGTGRRPHGDGPRDVLLYRAVHEEPDLTDLDGGLRPLVAAALHKDPEQRPLTGELLHRLLQDHALEQDPENLLSEILRDQVFGPEREKAVERLLRLTVSVDTAVLKIIPSEPLPAQSDPSTLGKKEEEKEKRKGGPGRVFRRWRPRVRIVTSLGALAVIAILAAAIPSIVDDPGPVAKPTYVIGFQGALSGQNAELGRSMLLGTQAAVNVANDDPDLPFRLKLVQSDDKGVADEGVPAAQRLVADPDVVAVIGPTFSGPAETSILKYSDAGLVAVSPSATAPGLIDLDLAGHTFFRIVPPDTAQGPQTAEYMTVTLKARKILLVSDDSNPYGQGLAEELGKHLERIRQQKKLLVATTVLKVTSGADYAKIPLDVNSYDLVYYAGYSAEFAEVIKVLRSRNFKGPIMSGDGSNQDLLIRQAGKENVEGVYLTCPCREVAGIFPRSAEVERFVEAYARLTSPGTEPDFYAADAYDAVGVIIQVLKGLGGHVTRQSVANTFRNTDFIRGFAFEGITKKIQFSATGDVQGSDIYLYQVRDGRRKFLGNIADLVRGNG